MEDQTTLRSNNIVQRAPRTAIILVDCLRMPEEGLFSPGSEGALLLKLGSLLASGSGGRLLLCSIVPVPEGESVSAYTVKAQARRQDLERLAVAALSHSRTAVGTGEDDMAPGSPGERGQSLIAPVVRVTPEKNIASEVRGLIEGEPGALLLLPLRSFEPGECDWLRKALRKPLPCDVGWARPPVADTYHAQASSPQPVSPDPFEVGMRVLVPARGGPQAELALELSQDLMDVVRAQVTVLHVVQDMPESERATEEAPFVELLSGMSAAALGGAAPRRTLDISGDPVKTISAAARDYSLLVMGAGAEPTADVGAFTEQIAARTGVALLAVKSRRPVGPAIRAARRRARPHVLDPETLSLMVDKWFAENTFHAAEYSDLARLVDMKRKQGLTISLGLPTLNEENTIGEIIRVLKSSLLEDAPLLDEIVVIDSDSTDCTREIAAELGVPVHIHQQVLPQAGEPLQGKGEALWKSLHVLKGDIIAWVDTDVSNMHPQFVYGLVGPLLREPRIGYVKGYYHRPIQAGGNLQHEGGGRVTELTVRPLINLFFPLLSGLVQPLAGEYAGRRKVLEQLPFFSGYGVETGLLIDLLERFGLSSIGQVNLEMRVHRNRTLADLSLTAFAIVQVILTRLEERARVKMLEELNRSMKLIRFEEDHLSLVVRHVRDEERPPIATIPAYKAAHP
jgi:glucosyl-3-phosphoglycerate synthase